MLEIMNEYSARISSLMAEKGWDRTLAAAKVGVSYQGLKKVLDAGGEFKPDNLFAAARAFNVSPYWLHTGIGQRGSWVGSLGDNGAESGGQGQERSYDAMIVAKMYDDLPKDNEIRRQMFRRVAALLLRDEPTASPLKSGEPSTPGNPEKQGV